MIKLGEDASTLSVTNFATTNAYCAKYLVYTATTIPAAANNAAAGVDVIAPATPFGQTVTVNRPAVDKTATYGTHTFAITASDWWGVDQTAGTLSIKVLISSDDCEAKDALTLTWSGADAATYALGSASVDYAYSVVGNVPNYCTFTYTNPVVAADV